MDSSLILPSLFPVRNQHPFRASHWISAPRLGHLQIVETNSKEHAMITNLIVELALRGAFNLIAVDEWLPDRDTLQRALRRYTLDIEQALHNPKIKRPMTCFQLFDLFSDEEIRNRPTLFLNFLHHFYNADVKLSVRNNVLRQCCQQLKQLSLSNPVVVLVPHMFSEEYKRFFPVLTTVADELISTLETIVITPFQKSFL